MRDILDFSGTGKDGENTYGHDFNVNAGVMTRDTWTFSKQYNNGGMDLANFELVVKIQIYDPTVGFLLSSYTQKVRDKIHLKAINSLVISMAAFGLVDSFIATTI